MRDNLKYNYKVLLKFIGNVVGLIVLIGIATLGIAAIHACYCVPDYGNVSYWRYLWNFILDNAPLIGTLTGFLGIFAAFWFLGANFGISPELVWTNTNRLKVSVHNNFFWVKLTDVMVEMDFIREERDGKDIKTKKIEMNKSGVTLLYGRLAGRYYSSRYTFHSTKGFVWEEKYDKIRCRVTASHGISGIRRTEECFYTKEQVRRGVFCDGKFIPQVRMYPTSTSEFWPPEVGRMCNSLQRISESVDTALELVELSKKDEMVARVAKARDTIKQLHTEAYWRVFPSLQNNEDTLQTMSDDLFLLEYFYKTHMNLNPEHKQERKELIDRICEYMVFLGDQMDNDIKNRYKLELTK